MTNPQTFPRKATDFHKIQHQKKFLGAFAACGSILRASRSEQIERGSHYSWMRTDPIYPERFRQAEIEAARALEDEAVRRAREGIRKPRCTGGNRSTFRESRCSPPSIPIPY